MKMDMYTIEGQETLKKAFGKNLSDIMYERHITQSKMSNELKIPKTTISGWMSGKRIPRAAAMEKLCKYLNCTRTDLFAMKRADNSLSENDRDKANTIDFRSEVMIAQKIAGSYELRSLFDTAIVSRPEDILLVTETLRRMNRDMS
jgi:transcriptional regulator with XRE-family HTH domain